MYDATEQSAIDELDDAGAADLNRQPRPVGAHIAVPALRALLYTIALRITNDGSAAEEVLQDVFHNVWQRAQTFRPAAGSVSSWLSGIARNRSIDEVRSRWHRARERELPLDHLPDLQGAVERGLEHLAVIRTDLLHAMSALPQLQRQAIELAYFGGFSSSEIAQYLNVPIGTIKGRLRLGMDKLREALRPANRRHKARRNEWPQLRAFGSLFVYSWPWAYSSTVYSPSTTPSSLPLPPACCWPSPCA